MLGCLKVENGRAVIHEAVFLQNKIYSLRMVDPEGAASVEMKGKGIPKNALKKKRFEDYFRMNFKPIIDYAEFMRIGNHKHKLEHLACRKQGLSSYNDKVFRVSPNESRPLGHWRNVLQEDEAEVLELDSEPEVMDVESLEDSELEVLDVEPEVLDVSE